MRISTKGRYALRMMLDLAENRHAGFIALKDIADRQNVSKKYLEQIVTLLNRADILHTNRGSLGGYRLAKSPHKYTVGEILRITEGSISPINGLGDMHKTGESAATAMTIEVWRGLEKTINDYLFGITLQDVLDRYNSSGNDYSI
ncbi:MAG: Rrf2 family transcriptional regulator [Planctomycetaceae bacterium]|jgi:Rrf2 family protein|nr:Rrf2 family transcriptional regulator [Planctomycetaceae bacterium]